MTEVTIRGAVLARQVDAREGVSLSITCANLPMRLGGWSEDEAAQLLAGLDGWEFAVLCNDFERDRLTEWIEWVRERRPLISHPRAVALVVRNAPSEDLRKLGLL